jgi:UDP-GlcNAc:undecaprenyl-phosphate GlcNAc-1-phosphate transferase
MIDTSFESIGLILFTTIFLSMFFMPAAAALAHRVGAIDIPKQRSSHVKATPRMGGLAISISLLISCLLYLPIDSFLIAFLSGLVVIVATGIVDDILQISPRRKFVGQIAAALLFVYLSGLEIEHVGNIVGFGNIELGIMSFPFTVFCIVGGMNAFNLSDGLDGLAGGLAVIAAVFFGYFALLVDADALLIIAISLIGVTAGFLRENSYPAKIFMGDGGSLMLGYVLATLLVGLSGSAPTPALPVASLAMVVALPLLDTLGVMARRVYYGHSPFLPDRTHLHHRLLELGLPHPLVVVVIYCLMLIFGILAITLRQQPDWAIFLVLLGIGLLVFGSVSYLQHAGFSYGPKEQRISTIRQTQIFQRVAGWVSSTAKPAGILILVALLVPSGFVPLSDWIINKAWMLALMSVLLVVFSWKSSINNKSILHGVIYLAILALLLVYEGGDVSPRSWIGTTYDLSIAVLAMGWVVLKLFFSKHGEIMVTSNFELLILFISWFIPFVVLKDLQVSAPTVRAVQHACLLSIPFLLAMKINIRINEENSHWISNFLVFGLLVIAGRSMAQSFLN